MADTLKRSPLIRRAANFNLMQPDATGRNPRAARFLHRFLTASRNTSGVDLDVKAAKSPPHVR